jgi:uncharacterized damage-inducible protein DinB
MNAKQHFTETFHRENATTRRVIHALPHAKSEFRPSGNSKTAREVAHIFSLGQGGIAAALTNHWQWPPVFPPAPATYAEVLGAFDETTAMVKDALANTSDSRLDDKVMFFTGPKQFGEIPVHDLIWFMLHDSIHHRGQLSTYLRAAGEKVPSIYGPSADEPW